MKKNPGHQEADQSVRRGFLLGLLALVILGLSLAVVVQVFRSRSANPTGADERNSSALAQNRFHPNRVQPDASGLGVVGRDGSTPLTAVDQQQKEELLSALLAAQSITDSEARDDALDRDMENISPEMAAALLADMKPEDLKGEAARRLFDCWATASPRDAVAWAQGQADPEVIQPFINLAATRWAATDLPGAAAWARGLPDGTLRAEILATVGSEAVRTDPFKALQLAVELPAGTDQSDLVARAVGEWAATDRDGAARWAAQIADDTLRQRMTEQVAVASAEKDPAGAATIALQQMPPGAEQDRALVSIVLRWVQSDPQAAANWVTQFPPNALGRDAMDNLINLWADRDLTASGNWLLTLPEGGLRNAGILAYARTLERTDADLARRWALSVTDDK